MVLAAHGRSPAKVAGEMYNEWLLAEIGRGADNKALSDKKFGNICCLQGSSGWPTNERQSGKRSTRNSNFRAIIQAESSSDGGPKDIQWRISKAEAQTQRFLRRTDRKLKNWGEASQTSKDAGCIWSIL